MCFISSETPGMVLYVGYVGHKGLQDVNYAQETLKVLDICGASMLDIP